MQESTNSAGESQASESGGESREPTKTQLEEVVALLGGDEKPGDDDDGKGGESGQQTDDDGKGDESENGKPGEGQKSEPPKTLNDVAERLGVEVKDLFDIEFNLGGEGESLTLGKLKDLADDHGQFEVDRLQFDETKVKREKEFLTAQTELAEIIQLLPKNAIKPELVRVLADRREQTLAREKGLTLKAIPDWADDAKQSTDRTAMQEHLSEYGYSKNYLESITDHRTLKYIRDNMQRQDRITRALAQVKKVVKPAHSTGGGRGAPSKDKPKGGKVRNVDSQVAAVAKLLDSG